MAQVILAWLVLGIQASGPRAAERFLEASPKVGERIPDVVAYDEAGRPFPLRERLRGAYTVLVFGCLT